MWYHLSPFLYIHIALYRDTHSYIHSVSYSLLSVKADREDMTIALRVRCLRNGFLPSATVTRDFFLSNYSLPNDPVVTPVAGEYEVDTALYVSLSCSEPLCHIYWSASLHPTNVTGALYDLPLRLPPGSHTIHAVTYAPSLDRPSRSLSPHIYTVLGNALPPPVIQPPSLLGQTTASLISVTLSSPVADTVLYYVVLYDMEQGAIDPVTADWTLYTAPVILTSSARIAVMQARDFDTLLLLLLSSFVTNLLASGQSLL